MDCDGPAGTSASDRRDELVALAAALLAEGRAVRLVARGGSMAPFIRDGEPVLLEPLHSPPRPGEVVLCRGPGGDLALHRMVRSSADGIVTRGDASASDDPAVAPDAVLGRAVEVSGQRRLHLCAAFGGLVLRGPALSRGVLAAAPLRPIARCVRALAARLRTFPAERSQGSDRKRDRDDSSRLFLRLPERAVAAKRSGRGAPSVTRDGDRR